MQGILSFELENGTNKRRKAYRACKRCKDFKTRQTELTCELQKRCILVSSANRCKRCEDYGLPCSREGQSDVLPSEIEAVDPGVSEDFGQNHVVLQDETDDLSFPEPEEPIPASRSPWSIPNHRLEPLAVNTLGQYPPSQAAERSIIFPPHGDQHGSVPVSVRSAQNGSTAGHNELRYATMLHLLAAKSSSSNKPTSDQHEPTKLISGTNPLSALLGKELKHKIVTNSCSFRTPDPFGNGTGRPSIRRDADIHSCDWEDFYRRLGVHKARLQYLRSMNCFQLPDPSHCAHLLQICFTYIHPMLPVIDRKDFLSRYYGSGEPPPLPLLQAVFLAATRYSANNGRFIDGVSEVRMHCDELHNKLRALIEAEITLDKTTVVQASLLASLHWEGREGLNSAIDNLSLAVRACQEMGLHRKQEMARTTGSQETFQRRLWWCTYALDRFTAAQEGTPFLINELDCDTEPLTENDLAEEDRLTKTVTMIQIKLARLIQDAVRSLCQPGEDHTTLFSSRGVLIRQRLDQQLEHLARQIKDKLTDDESRSGEVSENSPSVSSLFGTLLLTQVNTSLDTVRIIVHRPFLLYAELDGPGKWASRDVCRVHALDITSRLTNLLTHDMLRFSWPFTVYSVVNCLLIFWYDISAPTSTDQAARTRHRQHYLSVVNLLKEMGTTWWASAAKHKLAQALALAADELQAKEQVTPESNLDASSGGVRTNGGAGPGLYSHGHPPTPLSGANSLGNIESIQWLDNELFADCNPVDYWGSIGLDFELDVAANVFSIADPGQLL
ncbi:unnamed protein product [Clonostachys rosea]|uniref:Xylanolytic transcriptional activator regulatory domain-containing protein n=1 Tax=Bionectria ochroleuca TaxID=29856 RepID=A0ABY6U3S7_BIOOC|nr:unnamed protein product [Clonostachys rosea]